MPERRTTPTAPRSLLAAVAASTAVACSSPPAPQQTTAPTAVPDAAPPAAVPVETEAGLYATIAAAETTFDSSAEATLVVTVENRGREPRPLDLFVASSPILFLEFRDESGELVHTVPPPTPPEELEVVELAPGETRSFTHSLQIFSPELPPGRYRVRVRAEGVASEELTFTIR